MVSGNSLKLTVNHESCSADYFHYQLLHLKWCGAIDLLANITAQPALSLGGMNTLSCVQPPLPEQTAIAAYLDLETAKLDALVGKVEAAVENEMRCSEPRPSTRWKACSEPTSCVVLRSCQTR